MRYSINCSRCGRFCPSEGTEWETDFGSYGDLEPPDPEPTCPSCCKQEEAEYIAKGWVPWPWIPAPRHYRAAKLLGLVRATPSESCAWTMLFKPDAVPKDYIIIPWRTKND